MAGTTTVDSGNDANLGDHWRAFDGGGNNPTSFANQIDFLAHHHRVIAMALPR